MASSGEGTRSSRVADVGNIHRRGNRALSVLSGCFEGVVREAIELDGVVRAEELDGVTALSLELAQATLVPQARAPVLLHHPLIHAQAGRAARAIDVHLGVIK